MGQFVELPVVISDTNWIVVSNEVGLGIVPAYEMGRTYRDVLGRVNQLLASGDQLLVLHNQGKKSLAA